MLGPIVVETVRVIFGEALSRLIKQIFRDAEGASDEILLGLAIDTVKRHASKIDHLDSRLEALESALHAHVLRQIAAGDRRPSLEKCSADMARVTPALATGHPYVIRISTVGDFRRTYYGSAFLGRNSLRGAAAREELAVLSGTGAHLKPGTNGVYFMPQPNFPDHYIDGQLLRGRNTTLLTRGSHDIVIGRIALQLEIILFQAHGSGIGK